MNTTTKINRQSDNRSIRARSIRGRSIRGGRSLGAVIAAGALILGACGGGDEPLVAASPANTVAPAAAAPATTAAVAVAGETATPAGDVATGIVVTSGETSLGTALVGAGGLTLYGFTNDSAAASTCTDACAEAWPPLIVDENWDVSPDLDLGIFATTVRPDGQLQLVAGKWPLYFFGGDLTAGDVNGQGSGDVWFVAATDGRLLEGDGPAEGATEEAAPAASGIVSTGTTDLGDVLVDSAGLSLYGFTDDADGVPTCNDACADAWPPILADSVDGLDADVFSLAERADGTTQLVAGKWPLYLFAGDGAPGDINGQESGGVWFLAAPDGSLIQHDGDETEAAGSEY